MARQPRITITIDKSTLEQLTNFADIEHRQYGRMAGYLFKAAMTAFVRYQETGGKGLGAFCRELEGEAPEKLDPAELRVKSREVVSQLRSDMQAADDLACQLEATLEAEARSAQRARASRLRLASTAGARS